MSLNARYNRILVQVAEENLRVARARRVQIRELREKLRKRAAEEAPNLEDQLGVSIPLVITRDMKQQLADLGYAAADVKSMTPQAATDVISSGVTKGKAEMSSKRREKVLDEYEERTLQALEKAKKKLEFLKHKKKRTEEAIAKGIDKLHDLSEDNSDEANKRAESHEKMIDAWQRSLQSQEDNIQAQDKLVKRIIESEDGLIDELQELNDSAATTPTPEDDKILEQLVRDKVKDLSEIEKERRKLDQAQRDRDKKEEAVHKVFVKKQKIFDGDFDLFNLNELDDELALAQRELDATDKDVQKLIRVIMRHESHLLDKQTEQRIIQVEKEVEQAHQQLPEFEQIVEESKKDIAEEDPDEATGKTKFYKDQSTAMMAFVQKLEPQYRDFVTQFIGPDIPADPAIEKALRLANGGIIKRAAAMQQLSERYRRNDMHRSAILLAPVLYEILAKNMDAVLADVEAVAKKEASMREAEAIFDEMVEVGLLKEAISFKEMMEKGKDLGSRALDRTKELGERAMEGVDRLRFKKKDQGPRRDLELPAQQAAKNLQVLQEMERELKLQRQRAVNLLEEQADPSKKRRIRDAIRVLDEKLRNVGEKKNVVEKGLAHQPAPGMMKSVEQAARSSKSDYQLAVELMQKSLPELVKFLALIPDDESLEQEMLRQSDRIATLAHKLIKVAFKEKKRYPNLPPTIQAYGHMFIAIDDALDRALRSNEGVGQAA